MGIPENNLCFSLTSQKSDEAKILTSGTGISLPDRSLFSNENGSAIFMLYQRTRRSLAVGMKIAFAIII